MLPDSQKSFIVSFPKFLKGEKDRLIMIVLNIPNFLRTLFWPSKSWTNDSRISPGDDLMKKQKIRLKLDGKLARRVETDITLIFYSVTVENGFILALHFHWICAYLRILGHYLFFFIDIEANQFSCSAR